MRQKISLKRNIKKRTLKGNLNDVRDKLANIVINIGITILALQPEVGKTEAFVSYCKDHPDQTIGYFSPTHNLLDEVENRLKSIGITNIKHWKGANEKCTLIMQGDRCAKYLTGSKLSIWWFCKKCNEKAHCEYLEQFNYNGPTVVLGPSDYLGSSYIEKRFDAIFVDEMLLKCNNYSYGLQRAEVDRAVNILKLISDDDVLDEFRDTPSNPLLLEQIDTKKLKSIINNGLQQYKDGFNTFANLVRVLGALNNTLQFMKWKKIYSSCNTYENDLETYSEPHIYSLFKKAKNTTIVILDASFNEKVFLDLLEGYYGEFQCDEIDVAIYKSSVTNKKSKIYRLNANCWYPASSHNDYLADKVKTIYSLNKQLEKKVGIITSKEFETHYFADKETLHYMNLRGQNCFENFDVLIVVGTFQPHINATIDLHNSLYLTNIDKTHLRDLKDDYEDNKSKGVPLTEYKYPDMRRELQDTTREVPTKDNCTLQEPIKARLIESLLREEEMYQAIHRIRPLSNNKTIYVFGIVPDKIQSELKYNDEIYADDLIVHLEKRVKLTKRATVNIESLFEDGKRVTDVKVQIREELGYSPSTAYEKINKTIQESGRWEKKTKKVERTDRPVEILVKIGNT